jgi:hypothetical protein
MNVSQKARWEALRQEEAEHIESLRSLIEHGNIPRESGEAIMAHHQKIVEIYDRLIADPVVPKTWDVSR